MAAKGAREKIRLVSTAETGHFYTTDKNKRNMPISCAAIHKGITTGKPSTAIG